MSYIVAVFKIFIFGMFGLVVSTDWWTLTQLGIALAIAGGGWVYYRFRA